LRYTPPLSNGAFRSWEEWPDDDDDDNDDDDEAQPDRTDDADDVELDVYVGVATGVTRGGGVCADVGCGGGVDPYTPCGFFREKENTRRSRPVVPLRPQQST